MTAKAPTTELRNKRAIIRVSENWVKGFSLKYLESRKTQDIRASSLAVSKDGTGGFKRWLPWFQQQQGVFDLFLVFFFFPDDFLPSDVKIYLVFIWGQLKY